MIYMTQRRSLFFAALLLALGVMVNVASAEHSWGTPPYHWARTTSPFTLKLGNNLSSADWAGHLSTTSRDWNTPPSGTTTPLLTAIVNGQANKRCSMVSGTTQVCNGSYGKNGWLGLATINITGGLLQSKEVLSR